MSGMNVNKVLQIFGFLSRLRAKRYRSVVCVVYVVIYVVIYVSTMMEILADYSMCMTSGIGQPLHQ